MTEDEYSALIDAEHMTWCVGNHDEYGACFIDVQVPDSEAVVHLEGVPTDHQHVEVLEVMTSVGEIDAVIAVLTQMRDRFAAQDVLEAIYEQVDW